MSPQFVDFDADGKLDIVAGTFSGSPYVAYGTEDGWKQPEPILDRRGERILLNQFWNFEDDEWQDTERCDPEGGKPAKGHLTSAWAMDWDRDGDQDLLLGDYDNGYLYLRLNEGSAKEAAFVERNVLVEADGKPLRVEKTATMRVIDWNGDGHDDLVVSSIGKADGGSVYAYPGAPVEGGTDFGAPVTLLASAPSSGDGPARPVEGLYADLADHDGDGDLDLFVGGYAKWDPEPRDLTAAEAERVKELQAALAKVDEKVSAQIEAYQKDLEGVEDEAEKDRIAETFSEGYGPLMEERQGIQAKLDELVPRPQRRSFVWLYENTAKTTAPQVGAVRRR